MTITPIEELDPEFTKIILGIIDGKIPAYIDGDRVVDKRTGQVVHVERNERCPCNSGLKWKRCCGSDE
jgi:hypothetical protein